MPDHARAVVLAAAFAVPLSCASDDSAPSSPHPDGSAGRAGTGGSSGAGGVAGDTGAGASGGALPDGSPGDANADVPCTACGAGEQCSDGGCVPITWSRRLEYGQFAEMRGVAAGSSGPYVAFGSSLAGSGRDAFVAAFDATGTPSFIQTIAGGGLNEARSGALTADGHIIVCGGAGKLGTDAFVAKLSPIGGVVWATDLAESAQDVAVACRAVADSGAWVVGDRWNGSGFNPLIVKLDAKGVVAWARSIDATAQSYALATTGDGVVVVGGAGSAFAVALDAQGTLLWSRRYLWGTPAAIAGGADGSLCLSAADGSDAIVIAKLAPDGQALWANRFSSTLFVNGPTTAAVRADGGCAVAAAAAPTASWFVMTTAQGALAESKLYVDRGVWGLEAIGTSGYLIGGFNGAAGTAYLRKSDPLGEVSGCPPASAVATSATPADAFATSVSVTPLPPQGAVLALTAAPGGTTTASCD